MSLEHQIIETTECRRHNGQCEYGDWLPLADAPEPVQDAISSEVGEAMHAGMRHEERENTDDAGTVDVGGQRWVYRR